MSAEVVPLDNYRKPAQRTCACDGDFTCYSHRLVELAARIEDVHADVEEIRFCDWSTFDRLAREALDVLGGIVAETLPSRDAR